MEKTYILYSQSREDMEPILIKATTDINEMFETCTECWLGFDYEEIFEEEFTVESLQKHDFIDFGYDDDGVKCVFEKRETDNSNSAADARAVRPYVPTEVGI